MKERYCEPNLPKSRVLRVFVSGLMPDEIINELKAMMIHPYKLGKSTNMSGELAYHPDILLNNVRKGMWICESDPKYLPKELPRKLFNETETELGDLYPHDCPFNNFTVDNKLFCGKSVDYLIKAYALYEKKEIVYVSQNYTKCCTILVNNTAFITCDKLIGLSLRNRGYDVLTIGDDNGVGLSGYSHGLIGGCAAKISEDTLAFTGNLNTYKYGDDIIDFCANHNVDCFSLTNKPMYDYGGILPITELTTNPDDDVSSDFEKAVFANFRN